MIDKLIKEMREVGIYDSNGVKVDDFRASFVYEGYRTKFSVSGDFDSYNKKARLMYKDMVKVGTKQALLEAVKGAEGMVLERDTSGAEDIYRNIAKIGTSEAIREARKGIETLMSHGEIRSAGYLCVTIAKIGTSEAIREAIKGAEILGNWEMTGLIYEAIAEVGTPKAITEALKRAERLIDEGEMKAARWIYTAIANTGTPKTKRKVFRAAKHFDDYDAWKIYAGSMNVGVYEGENERKQEETRHIRETAQGKSLTPETIRKKIIETRSLVKKVKFQEAREIYKELSVLPMRITSPSISSHISSLLFPRKNP